MEKAPKKSLTSLPERVKRENVTCLFLAVAGRGGGAIRTK
jgi:hypothetical protein